MKSIRNSVFFQQLTLILLLMFLCTQTMKAQKIKEIYIEPHVGLAGNPTYVVGGSVGADFSFFMSKRFAAKTGVILSYYNKDITAMLDIPIYASAIIPIGSIKLELDGGPYLNLYYTNVTVGISLGATVRLRKVNLNISGFKRISQTRSMYWKNTPRFDVSIGIPIKL